MPTIGTPQTAAMFASLRFGAVAPEGFRKIGQGCSRVAYLEKSTDIVYKVGGLWANRHEADISRRLKRKSTRSLGFDLVIPQTRLWYKDAWTQHKSVNAQTFAKGAKATECAAEAYWDETECNCDKPIGLCYFTAIERVAEWSGLEDVHSNNLLVDKKNVLWLIDMGG